MGLLDSSSAGEGGSSHLDDLEALEQVAGLHPDPRTFERWLRSVFHREATPGGVTLSTVHRVKGQEWDRVAVFGVTAGLIPHRLALDVEEERRVLHVAITRARRRAVLLEEQAGEHHAGAERQEAFRFDGVGVAAATGGSWRPFAPGFKFQDRGFGVKQLSSAPSTQRTLSGGAATPYAFEASSL